MTAFPLSIIQQSPPGRGVVLQGASLPFQGVQVGGEHRTNINWFAGNPVASAQPNGLILEPIPLTGDFKDHQVGRDDSAATLINFPALSPAAQPGAEYVGGLVGGPTFIGTTPVPEQRARTARAVSDALERLMFEGIICKFEWGHVVRYGLVGTYFATWRLSTDCGWELEFRPTGLTLNQPKPSLVKSMNLLGLLQALLALIDTILAKIAAIIGKAAGWIGAIQAGIDRIVSYLLELAELLRQITSIVNAPRDLLQRLRASLQAIVLAAREVAFAAAAVVPSVQVQASRSGDPADVGDFTLDAMELRDLIVRAGAEAAARSLEVEQAITSSLIGVIVAPSAMTLQTIAKRAYGDATKWQAIREFNGFTSSIVPTGTVVRIPNLAA